MVDDFAVFDLWAEEDDFCIFSDFDGVAGGPVKKVAGGDGFLLAVFVGDGDFAFEEVTPVRRLAEVVLESFEQGRDVGASAEGKVFAGDFTVAGRVAEIEGLTSDGTGDLNRGGNLCFWYVHDGCLVRPRERWMIGGLWRKGEGSLLARFEFFGF